MYYYRAHHPMSERRQTALGVARARFVEGLPRKAREVKASLALLAGTPDEERPREELRRRLHALYASAQVFRIQPLANALRDAIASIDRVREAGRGFDQAELDALANLAATLPGLGATAESDSPSVAGLKVPESIAPAQSEPRRSPRKRGTPKPRPRTKQSIEPIVSVLVVDDPAWQARVRAALPPERFELMMASDPEEALRLARSGAPDVVLADRTAVLAPGIDLIGRLREDPLTDFVPVILLLPPGTPLDPIAVREAGADEALVKPFDADALLKAVARLTRVGGAAGASTLTGELTVEEIAERLAGEVKRGLVDAAAKGKDVQVPVGDGTHLLAAAWSAIGRVRAHLAERSGGRVRFREGPARGGPAFVTVVDQDPDEDVTVDLAGRRALVVDDDPAVVWFFAGLLREQGAEVAEAGDGIEALQEARRRRPDLILSDILMPRLDGFGLTRALKRDPLLADVPVIVLSWKEDFLQRMRQLHVGASGYLRKEAASGQILAAVREVLKPRARVEAQLRAGGEVRGRLEDLGIQTLMTTIVRERPNARLTVRDAANLYEVDLRDGELVDVTRTASDGSFARGERVLQALLGATTGRYTVADSEAPVRRSIDRSLREALESGMAELAAQVDAISGRNLAKAVQVELDDEVVDGVLRSSPEEVEKVVDALRDGHGPRALLMNGTFEPQVLEEVLVDLARQGAIRRVIGPEGEDRIAMAREARERGLHPELSEHEEQGTLSWLPAAQTTEEILLEAEQMAASAGTDPPVPLSDLELVSLRPPPVPRPNEARVVPPEEPQAHEIPSLDEPFAGEAASAPPSSEEITIETWVPRPGPFDEEPTVETRAPAAKREAPRRDEIPERERGAATGDDDGEDLGQEDLGQEDLGQEDLGQEDLGQEDLGQEGSGDEEHEDTLPEGAFEWGKDGVELPPRAPAPPLKVPPAPALLPEDQNREDLRPTMVARGGATASHDDDARGESSQPISTRESPARAAPAPPAGAMDEVADEQGTSLRWLAWAVVALVFGAIGFVGWRLLSPRLLASGPGPVPPVESTAAAPDEGSADAMADHPSEPESGPGAAELPRGTAAESSDSELPAAYGREEAGTGPIAGVTASANEGLLVLEPSPGGAVMTVRIGDRELRIEEDPVALALEPGVHHLTVLRGDHQDFLWVAVRTGHTRFVPPLP